MTMMVETPAEESPMDAYTSYILHTTEARLGDLRREAAEHALSCAARGRRASLWARVRDRFGRGSALPSEPAAAPVISISAPTSSAQDRDDARLVRRSA